MVIDRNIRQGDALFDLGSLADIRQLQIALCGNGPAKSENGETKSKWLKRKCFHIVAITLPRFSALRYQIIANFSFGSRVELVSAMESDCLVADLCLKYRIFVLNLALTLTRGGVQLMNSGPTLSIGATGHDVRRLQRIFVMTKALAPQRYHRHFRRDNGTGCQRFPARRRFDGRRDCRTANMAGASSRPKHADIIPRRLW